MRFKNRTEAGILLAKQLSAYRDMDVIVYAIPRGGVVTAVEIARYLSAPLELLLTRKIGHPYNPEYAIAAVSENGYIIASKRGVDDVDEEWLQEEFIRQKQEIKRRRNVYDKDNKRISATGKVAILVDDGIATGLSIRVAIAELKQQKPKKLIVAIPVTSKVAATTIQEEVDEFIGIEIPTDDDYIGSVSAYYDEFPQVTDDSIVSLIESYRKEHTQKVQQNTSLIQNNNYESIYEYDEP